MSNSNSNRQVYDPKLDRLYMKTVKCPYCRFKIRSMQTTCEQCGLSKMQIARASNKKAKQMMKERDKGKIVMINRRPDDIKLSGFTMSLITGIFGTHCFYVGRRTRGFIMLGVMFLYVASVIIFPMGIWEGGTFVGMHPWREAALQFGVFPADFLGLAVFMMWMLDVVRVLVGWFKYPVRLGDHPNKKKEDEVDITGDVVKA